MSKVPHPTLRDVARLAKVSPSTVSRVLHGGRHVRVDLAQTVVLAARKLGYTLNPFVSDLMMRRRAAKPGPELTPTFAWIEPFGSAEETMSHPVQRRFFEGGKKRAEELGCRLERFQSQVAGMTPERLTGVLAARGIEGVILLPQPLHLGAGFPVDAARFACVSLGRTHDSHAVHTAASNLPEAMRIACLELHRRGYRRIGCMLPHFVERMVDYQLAAGYLAAVGAELRLDALPVLYGYGLEGNSTENDAPAHRPNPELVRDAKGKNTPRQWLEEVRPDAVISTHVEARDALVHLGWRVPEDVGFVHLGQDPNGTETAGVDQRLELVAAAAVDLVIAQLTRNERGLPKTPKTLTISGVWRDGPSLRKYAG
jgi:LacI family transcriptional regulator